MFAKMSEKKARGVRQMLALGWIVIIISLFWDPITVQLTKPNNTASPFRLNPHAKLEDPVERYQCPVIQVNPISGVEKINWAGKPPGTCDSRCVHVQGQCLIEEPYSLGAHFFWGLLIPLVPLFLMVFGHEAWRRICPLSFFSQVPRALGIQRTRKVKNQRTGKVEKNVVLLSPQSWLARYHWFVQFGFLFVGLTLRIYYINSDRFGLGIFFIAIIVVAIGIGYLYGGKTWCNYLCPISPVQKFYTEPRGLLESASHLKKGSITQSMCRTSSKNNPEQSNCVGCKAHCSDIDLERAYWESHDIPGRRFFYFGYLGFVIGAFTYSYLYSGSWDYYNSGAWSHQEGQLSGLWKPGFYWNGLSFPIPKWIAGPLYVAAWVFLSYGVGRLAERFYKQFHIRQGKRLTNEQVRHQLFVFSSYLTINIFYCFAGRVYLNMLPGFLIGLVDVSVVALSSFWAWRNFGRTRLRYKREDLEGRFRSQLQKTEVDFSHVLEGRQIDELSPDETYVLAKTLPDVSKKQKAPAPVPAPASKGKVQGRCVGIIEVTHDVKTFSFVTDPPGVFSHKPGQFLTFDLEIEGQSVLRSYTISSSPSKPHTVEVTIKRVPGGLVSNWLHDNMKVGDEVGLRGPGGKFNFFEHPSSHALMISGGSGITPLLSMARWICDTGTKTDVVFMHAAKVPNDIINKEELESMDETHDNFRLLVSLSKPEPEHEWEGLTGRISLEMIQNSVPDFMERTIYVCGPEPMMVSTKKLLEDGGFPMKNYHQESFGSAPSKTVPLKRPKPVAAVSTSSSTERICFKQSDKEVVTDSENTILELAEENDVPLSSACRSGVCGACKVLKTEGEVNTEHGGGLEDDEIEQGYILACVSRPKGRVVIEA